MHLARFGAAHPCVLRLLRGLGLVAWTPCVALVAQSANLIPLPDLGLRIYPGFRITQFASAEQAPNVTAMTVDFAGRVIVAGPGYMRALPDLDRNGVADRAMDWPVWNEAPTGLASIENEWVLAGAAELYSMIDMNGDGVPDSESDDWFKWPLGPRSGRSVVLGPGGTWYVGTGDQAALDVGLAGFLRRPFRAPLQGGVVAIGPEAGRVEALSAGFHNPAGLSFNPWGDLFTADESDAWSRGLPWERRSALCKVTPGSQHGWRKTENGGGFALPFDHYSVARPILAMDFGQPSDLLCYRHYQFPEMFREGFFVADWRMGRVLHVALRAEGANYTAEVISFLDSYGRAGFTPSALAVQPDGSLLVAAGGRRAGGGVYLIQYVADPAFIFNATNWWVQAISDVDLVMGMPQPDAAWARHDWIPRSGPLEARPFGAIALNERFPQAQRVRAIEILTARFGGMPTDIASQATAADVEEVRARAAWSLSFSPVDGDLRWLMVLTRDASPYVRLQALNTLSERQWGTEMTLLQQALGANLAHPDRDVRHAAARLALQLTPVAWEALWARRAQLPVVARLSLMLSLYWRDEEGLRRRDLAEEALASFQATSQAEERLAALQMFGLAIDANGSPSAPGWFFQQAKPNWLSAAQLDARWTRKLLDVYPSGHRALDLECSQTLAVLEANDALISPKVLSRITPQTSSADHLHNLAVLARLRTPLPTNAYPVLAEAILTFGGKRDPGIAVADDARLSPWLEVVKALLAEHPGLDAVLLRHPRWPDPDHVLLTPLLGADHFVEAAGRFLAEVQKNAQFPWSAELVRVLESLPDGQTHALFRRQWDQVRLREALVSVLSREPVELDRDMFLWALDSPFEDVVRQGLSGLQPLNQDRDPKHLMWLLRALWRAIPADDAKALRRQVLELWQSQTGNAFTLIERQGDTATREQDYSAVFESFRVQEPLLYKKVVFTESMDPATWALKSRPVRWAIGNADRGGRLYQALGCADCHESGGLWGPGLVGLARRVPQTMLWDSIVFPNRILPPEYRVTVVETVDGATYRGAVLEDTPEMLLLQPQPWRTVRIYKRDVKQRYQVSESLMPGGLVDKVDAEGLADLQAFLRELR